MRIKRLDERCEIMQGAVALSLGTLIIIPFLLMPWQVTAGTLIFGILWIMKNRL